jgi:signal transduction histidine kinase
VNSGTSTPSKIIEVEHKVTSLKMDSLGNLWCGTNNGLLKIVDDSIYNKYEYQINDSNSLYSSFIKSIEFDANGRMWVGTKEGLSLYHPKLDNFTTITKKDGLPNELIYGILAQKNGKLWLSTNKGLCQFDSDSLTFRKFTTDDNLQSNEFNTGAYHLGKSGFMYFGGINGLNIFNPTLITQKLGLPLTTITGIELFHEPLPISTDGILREHPSSVDTIRLTHKQNSLTFLFTSINFVNPKNSRFRYKLSKLNSKWVETSLPVAEYTNLNPGTYQFSASSAGRNNKWSDIDHPIVIVITPPIWKLLWFQVLIGIVIIIIIFSFYRWRIQQFKIQQLKLEGLVQQRTEEIAAQNEELQSQSDAIMETNDLLSEQKEELNSLNNDLERKVKDRTESLSDVNSELSKALSELDMFIYRSSHDLRGPVASLLGLCTILQMQESKDEMLDVSDKIATTTNSLNTTLDKLLTINVINRDTNESTSFPVKSYITVVGKFYQEKYKLGIGKLTISIQDDLHINTDPELFQIILDQLFVNAITFNNGIATDISILGEEIDGQFQLSFIDSGQGISEDIEDSIFQMFFRGSDKSKGNGLGLYVVKKAIDKLGGKISFTSVVENGTTFTLLFPK